TLPFDPHWPSPEECGYREVYSTAYAAHSAAIRSRSAFKVLLARCTMAIALHISPETEPPAWVRLLTSHNVPSAWIQLLRTSITSNFSPQLRVGAFFDLEISQWMNHIPCMIRANVPVYIRWTTSLASSTLQQYPFLSPF
ncbi:uncharacterized protein BXZ73DRAFT_12322, partial [Epithele typhae]|uniref:uncharacterized protein n=1 Tax=Epithele typhae TaxID=378194 RepID=UPI0020088F4C